MLTEHLVRSPSLIDEGEQLMLITGGRGGTVRLVESLSLSAELRTVSEMVLLPDELKLVRYDALDPLDEPPLHE